MPRQLKPQKVETFQQRESDIKIDLFLDRNDKDFFAEYGSEVFRADDIQTLRNSVNAAIKESITWEWKPIIEVDYSPDDSKGSKVHANLSLSISRFYYTLRDDGKVLHSNWNLPPSYNGDRNAASKTFYWNLDRFAEFQPPCTDSLIYKQDPYNRQEKILLPSPQAPRRYFIPYTEDLWLGLESLVGTMHTLHGKLSVLLQTDVGYKTLIAAGSVLANLLPEKIE